MKQAGLELAHVWDFIIANDRFTCYATMLAPNFPFKKDLFESRMTKKDYLPSAGSLPNGCQLPEARKKPGVWCATWISL